MNTSNTKALLIVWTALTLVVPASLDAAEESTKSRTRVDEWVRVPAGEYVIGTDAGRYDERPRVTVRLSELWIARREVTNEEFERFVTESRYVPRGPWRRGFTRGGGRLPVRFVTWHDATAYAAWAGCRLPTEAEWAAAATKIATPIHPRPGAPLAAGPAIADDAPGGIADLAGNVREWTADWYDRRTFLDLAAAGVAVDPRGPEDGAQPAEALRAAKASAGWERSTLKVVRGGSFAALSSDQLRPSRRSAHNPQRWHDDVGFRCARSAAPEAK
ncbi:formylglycine-generating enzyme family protein [Myxococcota bacterium]|nr:formylglycine-generating enzyme family protein [Myxococcota bacterium]